MLVTKEEIGAALAPAMAGLFPLRKPPGTFGVNYVLGQAIVEMNIVPGFAVGRPDHCGIVFSKPQALSGGRIQIHQRPRMKPPQGWNLPAG